MNVDRERPPAQALARSLEKKKPSVRYLKRAFFDKGAHRNDTLGKMFEGVTP